MPRSPLASKNGPVVALLSFAGVGAAQGLGRCKGTLPDALSCFPRGASTAGLLSDHHSQSVSEVHREVFERSNDAFEKRMENFPKYVRRQALTKTLAQYEIFRRVLRVKGSLWSAASCAGSSSRGPPLRDPRAGQLHAAHLRVRQLRRLPLRRRARPRARLAAPRGGGPRGRRLRRAPRIREGPRLEPAPQSHRQGAPRQGRRVEDHPRFRRRATRTSSSASSTSTSTCTSRPARPSSTSSPHAPRGRSSRSTSSTTPFGRGRRAR